MTALLVLAALLVGFVCGRISDRWRMWRDFKRGGWLG